MVFGERGIRRGYVGSLWRGRGFKLHQLKDVRVYGGHSIQFGLFGLTSKHL